MGLDTTANSYLSFDVLLHVGTLLAVIIIFRKDIIGVVVAFFKMLFDLVTKGKFFLEKSDYRKLTAMLFIASIPLVIGAFFQKYFDHFGQIYVAIALIVTGILLLLTDRLSKNAHNTLHTSNFKDSIVVGVSQLIAIIPGLSRSGTTIFAGVASGLSKEFAVRFSFLLSAIAILGTAIFSIKGFDSGIVHTFGWQAFFGMLAAFIVGIIAIKWFLNIMRKQKLTYLACYCFLIAILAILFR